VRSDVGALRNRVRRDWDAVESSIDVLVPAAVDVVGTWYGRTQAAADGMPPHITVLWPWVSAPVPGEAMDRLRAAATGLAPFTVRLAHVGRFPGVVYLAPEPRRLIADVIARLVAAFPETPPYGGRFGDVPVPHLTVATSEDEGRLDVIEHALRARLVPALEVEVDRLTVSEEGRATGVGRWAVRADVLLGR
jgi:2'-5' RNA ligase